MRRHETGTQHRTPTFHHNARTDRSAASCSAMDTDAYGSFVSVDVDAIAPLFTLGIIAGTSYMDADDAVGYHPRHGLEVFKRAISYFKSRGVTAVLHLGNLLAAGNAAANTQHTALQSMELAKTAMNPCAWHFAIGAEDVACFGPVESVYAAYKPSRDEPGARTYYAVFPASFWRLVVRACRHPAHIFAPNHVLTALAGAGRLRCPERRGRRCWRNRRRHWRRAASVARRAAERGRCCRRAGHHHLSSSVASPS